MAWGGVTSFNQSEAGNNFFLSFFGQNLLLLTKNNSSLLLYCLVLSKNLDKILRFFTADLDSKCVSTLCCAWFYAKHYSETWLFNSRHLRISSCLNKSYKGSSLLLPNDLPRFSFTGTTNCGEYEISSKHSTEVSEFRKSLYCYQFFPEQWISVVQWIIAKIAHL